ncbi:MAG: hypothetical protein QXO12_02370, partial [Candidatus Pacearchaeota archaeon]
MKYKIKIVLILILFFILAQLIGIYVTYSYRENFYKEEIKKNISEKINETESKINISEEGKNI